MISLFSGRKTHQIRMSREQKLDNCIVILVDGPVQTGLVVLAPDVNVRVLLDQSLHDGLVTTLAFEVYKSFK